MPPPPGYNRPKRSGCLVPALIVCGVILLACGIVASGIITAFFDAGETADPPYSEPYPTTSAPEPPAPPEPPESDPTTEAPEPEPTESSPTTPPKKQKPPHLRKQRGYEVIPLPDPPTSRKEAAQLIKGNKVYGQKVANTSCAGLPNENAYPYGSVSNETWRKVAQTAANCARDMWAKPLAKAGYQATHAQVAIFSGSVDTPCGEGDAPGFYCSANQVIYLNKDGGGGGHPSEYSWTWYLMTMMHEYGHHAQARTGLLDASWRWQQSQEAEGDYFRVNRRLELQANCFGGMGLRRTDAVSRSAFETYASNLFGEKVHGSTKNQHRWYTQGWKNTKISRCNTYKAASKDVG